MSPGMMGLSFRVENDLVHGAFYYAGGDNPKPTVVLCHGFPGFEKNGDIAHFLRRNGFNVLIFSYRGAWGSQGDFSFAHVITDTCKAACYAASDEFSLKHLVRRDKIAIVGHSMGGFAALMASSRLSEVRNIVSIAGWNIGGNAKMSRADCDVKSRVNSILSGAAVLQGTSSAALWNEMYYSENEYDLRSLAPSLKGRNIFLIAAEDDSDTPPAYNHIPLFDVLSNGAHKIKVEEKWLASDHSFSDKRAELAEAVLDWLQRHV